MNRVLKVDGTTWMSAFSHAGVHLVGRIINRVAIKRLFTTCKKYRQPFPSESGHRYILP
jgi:hypothetical protein